MATKGTFTVTVLGDARQFRKSLKETEDALDRFTRRMDGIGQRAARVGDRMTIGVTAPLALLGKAATDAASDVEESLNKVGVVFGKAGDSVKRFADTAADSIGQSRAQALAAAGDFGNMFNTVGLANRAAADMSVTMVKLASDMASFNNEDPSAMLERLRSGLAGEAEPLRRFGVLLSAARVEAKAMELGLADATGGVSEAAKVQARYALILEDTKVQQGDFARTADGLANSQRTLAAEFADTRAELGKSLLPVMKDAVETANGLLQSFNALSPGTRELVVQGAAIAAAIGPVASILGRLTSGLAATVGVARKATAAWQTWRVQMHLAKLEGLSFGQAVRTQINPSLLKAAGRVALVTGAVALLTKRLADQGAAARRAGDELLAAAGGDARKELALLGDELERQQEIAGRGVNLFNTLYSSSAARDAANLIDDLTQRQADLREELRAGVIAAGAQSDALGRLGVNADTRASEVRRLAQATLGMAASADDAASAVAELTSQQDDLLATLSGLTDPVAVFSESLEAARQHARTWAEGQVEAGKMAEDAVSGFVESATVSLADYAARLEENAQNSIAFGDNLVTVASRFGVDIAQILSTMGEEGAAIAAKMADDVTGEGERLATALRENARVGGEAMTRELDTRMKMAAIIARDGGRATVEAIAKELAVGEGEIRRIATNYGIALASGLNPILVALGKKGIRVAGVTGVGGFSEFAAGGFAENHQAQIARAGEMRLWAEPETGGEAYIPLAASKRNRSLGIWRETGRRLGVFADGGFHGPEDVPAPPSFAPFRHPISTVGQAAAQKVYGDTVDWVRENAAPPLSLGIGYEAMMAALRRRFPGLPLISGLRPGAITATGRRSYHAMGRAVDIPPRMDVFDWIAQHYGNSRELIFSPAGGRQIHNGRPHVFGEPTRGDHWDHIHWAMRDGGLLDFNGARLFDQGGVLPPGATLAINKTGRNEYVSKFADGGFSSSTVGALAAEGLAGGTVASLDAAIAEIHALVAGWERLVRVQEEAARRAELVAAQNAVAEDYNRIIADTNATLEQRVEAHHRLADAQQAVADFDREAARAAEQRAIADATASLESARAAAAAVEAHERALAANRAAWEFEHAAATEQRELLEARLAGLEEFSDEWVQVARQLEQVNEQIRGDARRAREEARAAREQARREAQAAREEAIRQATATVSTAQSAADQALATLVGLLQQEQQVRERMADVRARFDAQVAAAGDELSRGLLAATQARHERLLALEVQFTRDQQAVLDERRRGLEQFGLDALTAFAEPTSTVLPDVEPGIVLTVIGGPRQGNLFSQLVANAEAQVAAFTEWMEQLEFARFRGVSEPVIQLLGLDESPEALALLRAFTGASEAEIDRFNAIIARRTEVISRQVSREHAGLLGDVGRTLNELHDRFAAGVTEVDAEYANAVADLHARHNETLATFHAEFTTQMAALRAELEAIGVSHGMTFTEAIAAGINSGLPGILAAVDQVRAALAELRAAQDALANLGGGGGSGSSGGGSAPAGSLPPAPGRAGNPIFDSLPRDPRNPNFVLDPSSPSGRRFHPTRSINVVVNNNGRSLSGSDVAKAISRHELLHGRV